MRMAYGCLFSMTWMLIMLLCMWGPYPYLFQGSRVSLSLRTRIPRNHTFDGDASLRGSSYIPTSITNPETNLTHLVNLRPINPYPQPHHPPSPLRQLQSQSGTTYYQTCYLTHRSRKERVQSKDKQSSSGLRNHQVAPTCYFYATYSHIHFLGRTASPSLRPAPSFTSVTWDDGLLHITL